MSTIKGRTRKILESNYSAIFDGCITIRFTLDRSKPIAPLEFPEIEDVAINSKCFANCNFCYVSAKKTGSNFENVAQKIQNYYGNLDLNLRPFQVAIGGAGEPTLHPDFIASLQAFHNLDIVPNYTTNGMHITEEILEATQRLCGGVAISCHPHLEKTWRTAINRYLAKGIKTCLHIIVGEKGSSKRFWDIYDSTEGIYNYVMLPYQVAGRAKNIETKEELDLFFQEALKRKPKNIAYGALIYGYLLNQPNLAKELGISLYEPEVLSGYRILDDSYKILRKSSYDLREKKP